MADLQFVPLAAHNPGPMTGSGNTTYLVAGAGDEVVMVDAGVGEPRHVDSIAGELRGRRLASVVVTHAHPDHVSGAPWIAERFAGVTFAKHLSRHDPPSIIWQPIGDLDRIAVGDSELIVLHTPGHAPDHLAFWHAASRTVLTGDLVIAGGSVMIQASRGGDMAQYLASLDRILNLSPARLLPAHGPEVTEPAALLGAYLAHRRMREEQVVTALRAGHGDVRAIAESIYHGLDTRLIPAAHENVRAHLEHLQRQGRAFLDENGRWRT